MSLLGRLAKFGLNPWGAPVASSLAGTSGQILVLMRDKDRKILMATGTDVPSNATAGYAKGCIFIDRNVATGITGLYENIGTNSSCNFNAIGAISAGEITLATGSILLGTAGVAAALDGKGDAKILVGNGATMTSVALSQDVTITNAGVATIAKINNLATAAEVNQVCDGCLATASEINVLAGVTAGTSAVSKALTLDAAESLVWATTDDTATETVTCSIQDTRTGAGTTGWTQKLELVSNVALGSYANAGYNLVTFGASGSASGLAAGVCGEVELSAGTLAGTYAAVEAELTANAEVATGTDTGFIYANIAGSNATGKTTINTNAHFAVLGTGIVNTADGLFDEVGSQAAVATARLRIKVGAATWYIPLCANSALN